MGRGPNWTSEQIATLRQTYHVEPCIDANPLRRIAERGVTGGLLGDPPPGRSAFDQRRVLTGKEC